MHHVIPGFQLGEIDIQRGARGLRVRGLEPARPLDFVPAENLRVGDHDHPRGLVQEAAGQGAQVDGQGWVGAGCPAFA